MTIGVWGYLKEYEAERKEIWAAIEKVLGSGRLILGPCVQAFEREFAAWCGASHGVGVDNGTNAISLGLRALGVGPGDEVATVSNTAVPTAAAIAAIGALPRFVDIDPATYLMDVSALESVLTPRTKAVVPVHLYGQCVDMDQLRALAEKHDLKVLEDCAQAHGARRRGRKAGSMGHASAFSFYPTKILGTFGDGGMVLCDDQEVEARLRRLRFYGMEQTYYAKELGFNSRLDEVHAAILSAKLKHLDDYIARRRAIAARYDRELAGSGLTLPATAPHNQHAYYLYVVRHPERQRIMDGLGQRGISVNISYPWPIHVMDGFRHLGYREGDLPHTEAAAREIFSLPMYPSLSDEEQGLVIEALLDLTG